MSRGYFILALIFLSETLFRLFPYPSEQHSFFLLNPIELHTDTYLYFLFEHLKVIGLVYTLYVENIRYRFVLFLFIADLIVYLLNYSSTLTYIYGVPVGMDLIKLIIFIVVIADHERRSGYTHYHSVRHTLYFHWACYMARLRKAPAHSQEAEQNRKAS